MKETTELFCLIPVTARVWCKGKIEKKIQCAIWLQLGCITACVWCLHSAHTNLSSHTGGHNKQVFYSAAGNAKCILKNYNNSTFTPAPHSWPIWFSNCAISLFIPFKSMDTIHSFHVCGHYSFLSLFFLSRGPLTESSYFPSYVGLHSTVVSTRLIPSGCACLGMPAHHACSTYVLSLHPRFNLWSRLLPITQFPCRSAHN